MGKSRSDCDADSINSLLIYVRQVDEIPGDIIEVGAYKCGATIAMAAVTDKTIYSFDLFGGLPYGDGIGFENFADANWEEIYQTTRPYANIVLIPGKHEDTIPRFYIDHISLIFMDSDWYDSHVVALKYFWPKLSPGGIIVFHDWKFEGVQKAIDEIITDHAEKSTVRGTNMGVIRKAK